MVFADCDRNSPPVGGKTFQATKPDAVPSQTQQTNETGHMEILKANYDLVVTAFTAGVLLFIGAPLPLWAVWAAVAVLQVTTRLGRGRRALDARRQAEMRAGELDKPNGEAPPFQ